MRIHAVRCMRGIIYFDLLKDTCKMTIDAMARTYTQLITTKISQHAPHALCAFNDDVCEYLEYA